MRIAGRRPTEALAHAIRWSDDRLVFGVRSGVGVLSLIGGLLSFLPVLGIWMLPVGAALIALDIPGLRGRLLDWADRHEANEAAGTEGR